MQRHFAALAALFAANLFVVGRLFTIEYTNHLGSIEAAFIAISHQWMTHGVDFGWWPLWYGGIPGQNTYPPLLHLVVAWVGNLFGISAALSHHIVTAAMYCLGALTVYWVAWLLSKSRRAAFTAGLLFSVTSASTWLIRNVLHDVGTPFGPRRLLTLVRYGEGPHIMSMTLLPVAVVLLHCALTRRKPGWVLLAALGLASVVLTNWLGAFALAAAVYAYLLAFTSGGAEDKDRFLWSRLGTGRRAQLRLPTEAGSGTLKRAPHSRLWLEAAAIGVYAYALAAPWVPPSTVAAVRTNAQWVGGDFRFGLSNAAWLVALLVACIILDLALRRRTNVLSRFSAAFTVLMGGITLLSEWFGINVLPQPHRYHVEMEMALCLLLAGILISLRPHVSKLAFGLVILLAIPAVFGYRRYADDLFHPIDIKQTIEYREAQWFDTNMNKRRVYAPGTVQFWLNNFTDTPQFGGGFAQGIINNNLPAVDFQVMSGMNAGAREGQIAVDWLRIFGVHAVGVSGPQSTEFYKPISNWKKFEGLLKPLWRDGDDVIYQVPQRSVSLARVVRPEQLITSLPAYHTQTEHFAKYLAAIDDPSLPDASWKWLDRSHARVEGMFTREHVLSIQMSYHPGWTATVNGQERPTRSDALSQLVVEPQCNGPCTVDLAYNGGLEMRLARWVSATALIAGLAAIGWQIAKSHKV